LAILPSGQPVPTPGLRHVLLFPALLLAVGAVGCSNLPRPQAFPPTQAAPPSKSLEAPAADPPAPSKAAANQGELRLTLAAGYYVRVAILSTPGDFAVRLLAPDGSTLEELQLAGGSFEPSRLSWLIETPGAYQWIVVPRDPAWPYSGSAIWLEEVRLAGACDEPIVRAERAIVAARWVMSQSGDSGLQGAHARALLEPVIGASMEAGDGSGLLAVKLEIARAARSEGAADAASRLDEAVEWARQIGGQHSEAQALMEQSQLTPTAQAMSQLRVVLEILRRLGDDTGEAIAHQLLANRHNDRGEPGPALQSFRKALTLYWGNGNLRGQAWTLGDLGYFFGDQGDLERSFLYFEVARELARAADDIYIQAYAIEGKARYDIEAGNLQASSDEYKQVLDLLAPTGINPQAAWALNGLARVSLYMGEPERARQTYREALSAFEKLKNPWGRADSLLGIGSTFDQHGEAELALEPFLQALEISRTNALPHVEGLALYDLGKLHRELRKSSVAQAELEAALALGSTESPARQAQTEVELGNTYLLASKITEAESAFQRAIELSARAPVVEAAAQAGRARLKRDRGDLAAARSAITRSLRITEELRSSVIRPDQRVSFLAARRAYYEFYVDLLMRLDRLDPGAGHEEEAVVASEQARARGLLDLLAKEQVDLRHGVPPALKERETKLGERIAMLQTMLFAETVKLTETEVERTRAKLARAEEEEKDLEAEIRRRDPAYAAIRTQAPLPLRQIQELLDEHTALLEYFQGEEISYLFVVTRQGLATHVLPPKRELAALVDRVRSSVNQDSRIQSRRFASDAYEGYRTLLLPAAQELRGKSHLMVAPDGALYSLSFEVLLTAPVPDAGGPQRNLPYLIRERSVSYVPSANVLARLMPADTERQDGKLFVGFGDPSENPSPEGIAPGRRSPQDCASSGSEASQSLDQRATGSGGRLRQLPAAREEVCRIAPLFPADQAVVFIGTDATEENVKNSSLVTWARNLHFATHGLLDEAHPERSGLKLAHASAADDGLLQVREIFNLKLHADLVVLSACESGLGKEVSGEGVIGMTRAFLYAGARSIVVSLWRVDDRSTSDLMLSFYRNLQETGDVSLALQHAKLDLIDHSGYFHPYFWAPFILVGLPR
jgi:CHAT domain-containing protein/Tfp pilus assembly protein PilF